MTRAINEVILFIGIVYFRFYVGSINLSAKTVDAKVFFVFGVHKTLTC